jgi:hypothetical protein
MYAVNSPENIKYKRKITCIPVPSKIMPSGAYVVPLTLYSEITEPCSTE